MTSLKHYTRGKVGEFDHEQLNQIAALLERIAPLIPKLESLRPELFMRHIVTFDAIIVASEPFVGSQNQWKYSWREAVKTTAAGLWEELPNGRTSNADGEDFYSLATNDWETHNDGAGEDGFGVVVDDTEAGYTVEMLPIPNDVHVTMRVRCAKDGEPFYSFEAPNAYDIVCTNTGGGGIGGPPGE
jgi:hypothetical protein